MSSIDECIQPYKRIALTKFLLGQRANTLTQFTRLLERHPERVVELAVSGMLPKNRLGRKIIKKLKVYAGPDHPHQAQQPVAEDLPGRA